MKPLNRRRMLLRSSRTAAAISLTPCLTCMLAGPAQRRIKIGACDWSLGRMANLSSFQLAKEIGLDGVQISLGTASDDMKLRRSDVQQEFRDAATENGVEIASLAIGELNNVPYKSDSRAEAWVSDSIDVLQALKLKVVLVPFFGKGDISGDTEAIGEVVRRLKKVAPKAERAGVSLGLESWLSAEETMRIMDRVGSPAVKMYYDVCNSNDRGYDIYKEIRWLGKKNICEFHLKENGSLLGHGKIDFNRVREAIEDIAYSGWVQIEGGVPQGADLHASCTTNCKYLRTLFRD